MSHFPQMYDIMLLSYSLKVGKRFSNIVCLLLPDKYKWPLCHQPWPALGTAAKDTQTGRMSLKISKPQPWLRWHQRRA